MYPSNKSINSILIYISMDMYHFFEKLKLKYIIKYLFTEIKLKLINISYLRVQRVSKIACDCLYSQLIKFIKTYSSSARA